MVRCRLARGAQPLRHRLRDATSPNEGRPWHSAKLCLFARGSPTGGNGDDRRQRRKQGVAVGAAASRMQATAQQTLGAATRPCLRSRLRGWTKDSLTGKLLLDSTSPSRLTPCHLPYRGEALAFRKALPPRQRLPLLGELSNEVRLRGWTKDSLTASH